MMQRQLAKHILPLRGQRKQDLPAVFASGPPQNEAPRRQPVYQFYCTVVLNLQPFRQFADARPPTFRQALQCQHQLVLARLESSLAGSFFAEAEKPADLVAQLGQGLVIR